ncbi:NOT2_3_5 domain-containing protein, partial [Haematococcus lacustris]
MRLVLRGSDCAGNLAGGAVQGGLPGARSGVPSLQAVNAGAAGRFGAAQLQSNLQQLGQYQARQGVIANGAMQQISSNAAAANAAADAAGRAALLNSHRLTAMRPGGDRNVGNNQLGGNSQLMQAFTQNQQSALAAALSQQGINLQGMNRLANVGLQNNLSRLGLGSNAVNLLQQGLGGSSASQPAADLLALLSRQTKAASGGPGGPPDKYGLLGLLPLLAMRDLDLTMLSLGTDLTSLGLNLNSTDSLNKLLVSPLSDTPIKVWVMMGQL